MPKLNEYIGGLVSSITNARIMSDLQTVKVAEEYAKHHLLKHFSVPRMRIDDIEMTIPVALDRIQTKADTVYEPIDNTKFNSIVYKDLLNNLGLSTLPADLSSRIRAEIASQTNILEQQIRISGNSEFLAAYCKNIVALVPKILDDKRLKMVSERISTDDIYVRMETRLKPEIKISSQKNILEELEVIVEAQQLREQPAGSLIQIKLRISEDGMEWNRSENGDGSIDEKLLPE